MCEGGEAHLVIVDRAFAISAPEKRSAKNWPSLGSTCAAPLQLHSLGPYLCLRRQPPRRRYRKSRPCKFAWACEKATVGDRRSLASANFVSGGARGRLVARALASPRLFSIARWARRTRRHATARVHNNRPRPQSIAVALHHNRGVAACDPTWSPRLPSP